MIRECCPSFFLFFFLPLSADCRFSDGTIVVFLSIFFLCCLLLFAFFFSWEKHVHNAEEEAQSKLASLQQEEKEYERKLGVAKEKLETLQSAAPPAPLRQLQERINELRMSLGLFAAQRSSVEHSRDQERELASLMQLITECGLEEKVRSALSAAHSRSNANTSTASSSSSSSSSATQAMTSTATLLSVEVSPATTLSVEVSPSNRRDGSSSLCSPIPDHAVWYSS